PSPRVAAGALLKGVPGVAGRRGGLPEALGGAGLLLDIPAPYQPGTRRVPSAAEVAPWVEAVIRLWDDADFYEDQRRRCLAAAEGWHPESLLPRFEAFFRGVCRAPAGVQ